MTFTGVVQRPLSYGKPGFLDVQRHMMGLLWAPDAFVRESSPKSNFFPAYVHRRNQVLPFRIIPWEFLVSARVVRMSKWVDGVNGNDQIATWMDQQGTITGGGLIRDEQGTCIAAFSSYYGKGTNDFAEMLALQKGLALCSFFATAK